MRHFLVTILVTLLPLAVVSQVPEGQDLVRANSDHEKVLDIAGAIQKILLNHTNPLTPSKNRTNYHYEAKAKAELLRGRQLELQHGSMLRRPSMEMWDYCNNFTAQMQKLEMPDWYAEKIWKRRREIECQIPAPGFVRGSDEKEMVALDVEGNTTDWKLACDLYPAYWQSTVYYTFYQAFFNIDVLETVRFPKLFRSALVSCFLQIIYSPFVLGSAIYNAVVIRRMLKSSSSVSVSILFPLLVSDLFIYVCMSGHFTTIGYILLYPLCYSSAYIGLSFSNFCALLFSVCIQWAFWFGCFCHALLALDKALQANFPTWHTVHFTKRAISTLLKACAIFCVVSAIVHAIVMPASFDAITGKLLDNGSTFTMVSKMSGIFLSVVVLFSMSLHLLCIVMVAVRRSGDGQIMSLLDVDVPKVSGRHLSATVLSFLLNLAGASFVMGQYFLYVTSMLQIDPLGYADAERVLYYCSGIFLPLLTTAAFYVQYFHICDEEKTGPALMVAKLTAKVQEKRLALRQERY